MSRVIGFLSILLVVRVNSEWQMGYSQALPLYTQWIQKQRKKLSNLDVQKIAQFVIYYSSFYGVDPRLILAVLKCESDFNPYCVSHKGAMGLGQLMPINVKEMGVRDPFDLEENIRTTIRLIRGHLVKCYQEYGLGERSLILALAAYNAGPRRIKEYNGVPPFKETQDYVKKVTQVYKSLKGF